MRIRGATSAEAVPRGPARALARGLPATRLQLPVQLFDERVVVKVLGRGILGEPVHLGAHGRVAPLDLDGHRGVAGHVGQGHVVAELVRPWQSMAVFPYSAYSARALASVILRYARSSR